MSSKHQDYLAQYYGGGPQTSSDFEPAKPKRKKVAQAAVKPLQGFKMIDTSEDTHEYEDFTAGISQPSTDRSDIESSELPNRKQLADLDLQTNIVALTISNHIEADLFIDYTADTKRREMMEASRRPSEPADLTPPRRPRANRDHDSETATRRSYEPIHQDTSGDLSPPRRGRPNSTTADLSPPRRGRSTDTDLSPVRRPIEEGDLSPPRRRVKDEEVAASGGDLSPPRRRSGASTDQEDLEIDRSMRMMNGERAGLQTGAEITAEARRKRAAENARLAAEAAALEDQGPVQTVYRDQHGRKIIQPSPEEEVGREETRISRRKESPGHNEHYDSSRRDSSHPSAGVSSSSSSSRRLTEEEMEARKTQRERWDDPLQRLKATGAIDSDEEDYDFEDPMRKHKKRKRESKSKSKSREWTAWFPPNRFNIRPGAQWDGVDRSNGFEQKMFQAQLDRTHRAEQAYRYTASDL